MNAIPQVATLSPDRAISAPAGKWTVADIEALYQLPLMDLLFHAQQVHRENFNANEIQRSTLLSVKTALDFEVLILGGNARVAELHASPPSAVRKLLQNDFVSHICFAKKLALLIGAARALRKS